MKTLRPWLYALWFTVFSPRLAPRTQPRCLGTRHDVDGIPVIHLYGTPYERGFQHGYRCAADLQRYRHVAWDYAPRTATERLGIPYWLAKLILKPILFVLAGRFLPALAPDVKAEMQGLADGAEADIREVAVLTLIWEIFAMIPARPAAKPIHCSEVAFDTTVSDGPLLGFNYDMLVPSDRTLVEGFMALFVVEPATSEQASRYIAPNTIGSIGLNTALNQHGVAFGWDNSYLKAGVPKGTNKTPYMLILRDIALHAQNITDVVQRLQREERQEADISVVADRTTVGVVELAGQHLAYRSDHAVWSCNRLQALAAMDYRSEGKHADGRPTRYPQIVGQTLQRQPITATEVAAILRDTTTEHGKPIASDRTAFTAIYDTAKQQLWVSFHGSPSATERLYAFTADGTRLPNEDIA